MKRSTGKRHIPLYDLKVSARSIREVTATLKSGWLSTGPKAAAFEKAITNLVGVRHGVAVSSATAGLITILEAVGVRGKEVITSPFSFVATAEAIIRCGGNPVFADVDPDSLTVQPSEVERLVGKKTACILPVDIAGFPADYLPLRKVGRESGVPIIADASHSLGTLYRGKSVPQNCDAAVFSFHATKNLACGEGGMVVSKRKELVDRVRLISGHGLTATAFERRKKGRWRYDVTALGFKANMSEVHAAIGLGGVVKFEEHQRMRRRLAEGYERNLSALKGFIELPHESKHVRSAWHLYIIKLRLPRLTINRDEFIAQMASAGIECGVHFTPITQFAFYRSFAKKSNCENAVAAGGRVISLPLYPGLSMRDVDYVCEHVDQVVRDHTR